MIRLVAIFCALAVICSCSPQSETSTAEASDTVTVIMSVGGNGDNGYNDLILSGAMRFYNEHEVGFSLQQPTDMNDVRTKLEKWVEETCNAGSREILLLASSDYKEWVADGELQLSENQQIVVFECTHEGLPEGVSSFRIGRYGAAYLAGCMAWESPEAHIVAAWQGDALLTDAIDGFSDGYRNKSGNEATVHYLATDYQGYSMPNEAYRLAKAWNEAFVFPLAGGSNGGIYKYSRENQFSLLLIAGMDVDCADYSTRIPFSVTINIDDVVYNILNKWYRGEMLPGHIDYNLSTEGVIDIAVNEHFFNRIWAWRDYYDSLDYWQKGYETFKEEAITKERAYYER